MAQRLSRACDRPRKGPSVEVPSAPEDIECLIGELTDYAKSIGELADYAKSLFLLAESVELNERYKRLKRLTRFSGVGLSL